MTSKVFCELCEKEIEDENNLWKYSLSNNGKKQYFAKWDLCTPCKEDFMSTWEQMTKKGKRSP